jgi:hypothetical protein
LILFSDLFFYSSKDGHGQYWSIDVNCQFFWQFRKIGMLFLPTAIALAILSPNTQKTHLSSDSMFHQFLKIKYSFPPIYNVEHSPRNHALVGDETVGYGPRADPWFLFKL